MASVTKAEDDVARLQLTVVGLRHALDRNRHNVWQSIRQQALHILGDGRGARDVNEGHAPPICRTGAIVLNSHVSHQPNVLPEDPGEEELLPPAEEPTGPVPSETAEPSPTPTEPEPAPTEPAPADPSP